MKEWAWVPMTRVSVLTVGRRVVTEEEERKGLDMSQEPWGMDSRALKGADVAVVGN